MNFILQSLAINIASVHFATEDSGPLFLAILTPTFKTYPTKRKEGNLNFSQLLTTLKNLKGNS